MGKKKWFNFGKAASKIITIVKKKGVFESVVKNGKGYFGGYKIDKKIGERWRQGTEG